MDAQPIEQKRIGPILLSPGVTPREVFTFLIVVALMGVMVSFSLKMQPYILTEILNVPRERQGSLAGSLAALQQAMVLLFVWVAGWAADKYGRKAMLLFATFGFTFTSVIYPLAGSVVILFVIRALFGISQTGHTAGGPTKMFDYPDNNSRGKFMALVMIFLNVATLVMVGWLAPKVPGWFKDAGYSAAETGRYSMWLLAAVGVFTFLLCLFGMQNDRKPQAAAPAGPAPAKIKAFFGGFGEVFRYAMDHPGFALLLITGFVIRTDTTVIQVFLAQWMVTAGSFQGLSTVEATQRAFQFQIPLSLSSLLVPLLFGPLLDRANRLALYCFSMASAGLALMSTGFITDVTTWHIFAVVTIIGLAEAAQTITQQALFGQEAPAHLRGTAYGVFAFTGTFSVVIISQISGVLFDKVGYTAPFIMAGALHLIFLGFALLFIARQRRLKRMAA